MKTPKKILVVDDDIAIVDMISDILIEKQHQVLGAFNGKDAFDISLSEIPDLIIMDWEMPVQNGIKTIKKLTENEKTKDIPVIIITGRMNSPSDLEIAFESGAIDFIRKPIEPIEIQARTRSMLMLSDYHKESIRRKNWELTNLTQTNQRSNSAIGELIHLIENVMQSCKTIDHFTKQQLNNNIQKVKLNLRNNTWKQFHNYFNKVHPDFSGNLLKTYPNISPEELKLSYFLRLNMSSKEIANITNKEIHSIDIARYRLRKKLGLERNDKLQEFLMNF